MHNAFPVRGGEALCDLLRVLQRPTRGYRTMLYLRAQSFPRSRCVGCNESSEQKLSTLTTPEFPHLRMQTCDSCMAYLLIVDLSRDAMAIPEVDELAGLPLDLWAVEHGYHKLQPNMAGI